MGFFDFWEDVKDNHEKSKEARECIQRAKELVKEGDRIYEAAYDKVQSYASETEYRLKRHMSYKQDIAKELGGNIGSTLKAFADFHIDEKIISAPSIQERNSTVKNFRDSLASCVVSTPFDMPSVLDAFISDDDYYEAKHQKDEAKRYKERMKMERESLYEYKDKMAEIRIFIDEEKSELDSLMEKIRKLTGDLNTGMKKSTFSSKEAEYLKGIHKIAECIVTLLSTEFLTDGFSINQRYQNAFSAIKNINQNLPYAPSITDSTTAAAIKKIIDGQIVY